MFHLTIPRARAGWAGGPAGAGWAGLGWGAWAGARSAPARETRVPTAVHIPALVPSLGREGRRPVRRAGGPASGSPGCPRPRSPGGSSGLLSLGPTWRIRSENKRRKWDTGRFPGSPLPSVLQINNPRLQRPPPRASGLWTRPLHGPLHGPPAPRVAEHRPRPRDPLSESSGAAEHPELRYFVTEKANPRGGWGGGRASWPGRLETAPALQLALSEKRGVSPPYYAVRGPNNIPVATATPQATPLARSCGLLVSLATPPSQQLKRTLRSSRFPARRWGVPVCAVSSRVSRARCEA